MFIFIHVVSSVTNLPCGESSGKLFYFNLHFFWLSENSELEIGFNSNKLQLSEVESRTQGSRPRPRQRTQKKSEAKDSLSEDRHSRGQGQECSRPRPRTKDTSASALQKKKKRSSQKFFRRSPKNKKKIKGLHKNFSSDCGNTANSVFRNSFFWATLFFL